MRRTTKCFRLLSTCCMLVAITSMSLAQEHEEHSDVEFEYDGGKIAVEFGDEGPVFEGDFPTEGIDLQFTGEPGFASELEEEFGIGAGDQVVYNVLSDLMFWNDGFQDLPSGAQIRIVNRPPSPVVPDTVVGAGTGTQSGSFTPALNRIGEAESDGDFHADLDFLLEPNTGAADPSMYGAYGFMVSLTTDATDVMDSDPFAMVFNFGLEEEQFEMGVEAFASVVPEPASGFSMLMALVAGVPFLRRRNRS